MGYCLFMRKGETHTKPSRGIIASDLAVGSSVYLMEDGVVTEYLVVNQGKPSGSSLYDDSCGGTWLLRKDIKENRQWHSSNVNDYKNSDIHAWLNGDFFNLFGSVEQEAIKQVKIPFVNGTGASEIASGENGLSCRAFVLNLPEVNIYSGSAGTGEGAVLSYFASCATKGSDEKRIAYLNETATAWWLRSTIDINAMYASGVDETGSHLQTYASRSNGARPALILQSTAVFDETTMLLKGVA